MAHQAHRPLLATDWSSAKHFRAEGLCRGLVQSDVGLKPSGKHSWSLQFFGIWSFTWVQNSLWVVRTIPQKKTRTTLPESHTCYEEAYLHNPSAMGFVVGVPG